MASYMSSRARRPNELVEDAFHVPRVQSSRSFVYVARPYHELHQVAVREVNLCLGADEPRALESKIEATTDTPYTVRCRGPPVISSPTRGIQMNT